MNKESEEVATIRSWVEGPRWAAFPRFLKKAAIQYDIDIEMEIENGWIRQFVSYKLKGPKSIVERCEKNIRLSLEEYNNE